MDLLPSPDSVEARQLSKQIDKELALQARKPAKSHFQILLLGQSESGKSTFMKQYKLLHVPEWQSKEALVWKGVIYLNIISAVRYILEQVELNLPYHEEGLSQPNETDFARPGISSNRRTSSRLTDVNELRGQLRPLLAMEAIFADSIGAGRHRENAPVACEMFVYRDWQKRAFEKSSAWMVSDNRPSPALDKRSGPEIERNETTSEMSRLLQVCSVDIISLLEHPDVKFLLHERVIVLKESSSFFFKHLDRISSPSWMPTDVDILYARVRTVGVTEFHMQSTLDVSKKWTLFGVGERVGFWHFIDVGGTVYQRKAWTPYFESSTAIIFFAPVSAFDHDLEEVPGTNRLQDSFELFRGICSSALLKKACIVLFLNKIDILREKLRLGIKVKKFISSYGDQPNDVETALYFFRRQFRHIYKHSNPSDSAGHRNRAFYTHCTTMVDIVATRKMMQDVLYSIVEKHLTSAVLI